MSLRGKSVLVTGGSGSWGQAFVRHILSVEAPDRVVAYSRDEGKHSDMARKLGRQMPDDTLRFFIGDVRDAARLAVAMRGVDVVVHAAALKQAPAGEYNPTEFLRTNVYGTQNVITAAIAAGVEKVLTLSSDKCVAPTLFYGMTKAIAERLTVDGNSYASGTRTKLSAVRYGNVIRSRGSVIPLFEKQRRTGELTITHPSMTRFLITMDEAVHFVLAALRDMKGGEVFVPKLPSARVVDIAEAVAPGVPTKVVGMRPAEKIHETLVAEGEVAVEQDGRFVILPPFHWFDRGTVEGVPFVGAYESGTNEHFLSVEEIRSLIGSKPKCEHCDCASGVCLPSLVGAST